MGWGMGLIKMVCLSLFLFCVHLESLSIYCLIENNANAHVQDEMEGRRGRRAWCR
jgi:hypothetical protein